MKWVQVPWPLQLTVCSDGAQRDTASPWSLPREQVSLAERLGRGWETHPFCNTRFGFGRKPQLRSQHSEAGGLPLLLGVPVSAANFRGVTLRRAMSSGRWKCVLVIPPPVEHTIHPHGVATSWNSRYISTNSCRWLAPFPHLHDTAQGNILPQI